MNYFNHLFSIFQIKLILNGYKTKCVTFLAEKKSSSNINSQYFFLENVFWLFMFDVIDNLIQKPEENMWENLSEATLRTCEAEDRERN